MRKLLTILTFLTILYGCSNKVTKTELSGVDSLLYLNNNGKIQPYSKEEYAFYDVVFMSDSEFNSVKDYSFNGLIKKLLDTSNHFEQAQRRAELDFKRRDFRVHNYKGAATK